MRENFHKVQVNDVYEWNSDMKFISCFGLLAQMTFKEYLVLTCYLGNCHTGAGFIQWAINLGSLVVIVSVTALSVALSVSVVL